MNKCHIEKTFFYPDKYGLHARPSVFFAILAQAFKSDIHIKLDNNEVDAKSMMGLMMLGIKMPGPIKMFFSGEDAKFALDCFDEYLSELPYYNGKFEWKV